MFRIRIAISESELETRNIDSTRQKEKGEEAVRGMFGGGIKRSERDVVEQRSMSDVNAARCFITVISFNKSSSPGAGARISGKIDF